MSGPNAGRIASDGRVTTIDRAFGLVYGATIEASGATCRRSFASPRPAP